MFAILAMCFSMNVVLRCFVLVLAMQAQFGLYTHQLAAVQCLVDLFGNVALLCYVCDQDRVSPTTLDRQVLTGNDERQMITVTTTQQAQAVGGGS